MTNINDTSYTKIQTELKEFLDLQNIKYTDNRDLFYRQVEKIVTPSKAKTHAIWLCKIREWSNILSINGYIEAEQYFSDLLRRISHVFRNQPNPWICRSASDEIILFCCLDISKEDEIEAISNKLLESISYSYKIGDDYIQNRLTMGISHSKINGSYNIHDLVSEAKIVMDQLTFSNYNSAHMIAIESGEQRKFKIEEKNREAKIKYALDSKQFLPYYQAVANTITGEIVGFECLARLEKDSQILEPNYFLPLIKSLQLTADLDLIICEKVIASIGIIHAKSPYSQLTFNVNVSGDLIRSPKKLNTFLTLIATAHLPSNKKLQIEIVEDSFEVEDHVLEDFFARLRSMNVNVFIDDFGLGFSSIDRLLTLPVYGVKLDSIFVSGLGEYEPKKRNFLEAIVKALSASDLEIVAESIETESQLHWIETLNVQKYQGYVLSKPISLQNMIEFMLTHETKPKAIIPKSKTNTVRLPSFRHFAKQKLRQFFLKDRREKS